MLGLSVDPRCAGTPSGGCMRETADPPRLLEHMLNSPEEEPPILPWLLCGFEASPLSYKRTNRHMIGYFYDTTFYLKRFSGPLRLSTERSAPSQNESGSGSGSRDAPMVGRRYAH